MTTSSSDMKRKLDQNNSDHTHEGSFICSDEPLAKKRNIITTSDDTVPPMYKYHQLLPECLKPDIEQEMVSFKAEIFHGIRSFYQLLITEHSPSSSSLNNEQKQPLSNEKWDEFEYTLSLMRRYNELHYPYTIKEKEELCTKLFTIMIFDSPTVVVDYFIQASICVSISSLIRKKEKLNIVFAWRPLYEILEKTYFPKFRKAVYAPKDHGSSIVDLVKKVKRYFAPSATNEIWEVLRPTMCMHDHLLFKTQGFLCLFLPTTGDHITWLDELMSVWSWVAMHPTWDQSFMTLIAETAEEQVGKIDWEPYMPFIFSRLLYAFDVPVGNLPSYIYDEYPMAECSLFASFEYAKNLVVAHTAKFIIWTVSPEGTTMDRLKKLLRSTESYYHPSNEGSWTGPIGDFLLVLCSIFGNRLNKEHRGTRRVPDSFKITDKLIKDFVHTVLPVSMKAMYSKSSQMTSCANHSLKFMAYLAPDLVFPQLMETCFHALQTLTETHQTVSALETLSLVIFPLLKASHYPDGVKYLSEIMMLTLPGIDTNDMKKTYSTLKFYKSLLVCLPLFGEPTGFKSLADGDVDMENAQLPECVQFFEDWCIQFLDKIFVVLSHQSAPKKDASNASDTISPNMFWSICDLFFHQLSPELHQRCSKKIFNFISTEFLINAKKNIGHMCAAMSYSNPKSTLELFIPMLYDKIVETDGKMKHLTDTETQWFVHILSKVILFTGPEILVYKDKIVHILELTHQSEEKKIVKSAGKLLKNVLRSLTSYYANDIRSVNPDIWNSAEFRFNHHKYWSEFPTLSEMKVDWHTPSEDEILFSIDLVNQFLKDPLNLIRNHIEELQNDKEKSSANNKQLKHALLMIRYIVRGSDSLFTEIEEDIIPGLDRSPGSRKINAGLCQAERVKDRKTLNFSLKDVSMLCHDFIQAILHKSKEQNPILLGLITKLLYPIMCKRGNITQLRYKQRRDHHEVVKLQSYKDVYNTRGQKYPRSLLVSRAALEYKLRCVLHNEAIPYTKTHDLLFNDLVQLSLGSYSIVRRKAQRVLFAGFVKFSEKVVRRFLPRFMDALKKSDSTDDERTGAIYCLEKYASVKNIIRDWNMMSQFLISISSTSHIDKQTIQDRLAALYDTYFNAFYHISITKENVNRYNDLLLSLLDLVEGAHSMHWKYQTLVTSFIMLMIRADGVLIPPRVAGYLCRQMVSDIDKIRHIAIEGTELILCQYKPVQKKKEITFPKNYSLLEQGTWENLKYPTSNEEWDSTTFFEKNYFGWYATPQVCKVYDYSSRDSVDAHKQDRETLKTEFNTILNESFVQKLFETMVIREDTFSETNCQLFKGFFQVFGPHFLEITKKHFEDLASRAGSGKQEELHYMSLGSEYVSGLVRGMKHWTYQDQANTYEYLLPVLDKILQETSMNCVGEWCECFEFAVCDKDPRRVKWIRDFMFDKFETIVGNVDDKSLPSSSIQVRYLRYLYGIVGETSWRDPDTLNRLLSILKKHLAHPYEQVREYISVFLSMIFKTMWKPARDSNNIVLFNKYVPLPQNMVEFVQYVEQLFNKMLQVVKNSDTSAVESPVSEAIDLKSVSKTILNWSNSLFSSYSPHCAIDLVTHFINVIAAIYGQATQEDEDTQTLAADNLVFISAYPFPSQKSVQILEYLETVLHQSNNVVASNWRVREALLEFLQVFGFRQQFYLAAQQEKLIELILSMLKDPQLEVRECACTTLAGFIKISDMESIERLTERFRVWVKSDSAVGNRKQNRQRRKRTSITSLQASKPSSLSESDALLRHSGVLGLSAIVKAFPYTMPDFLPPVLVQLSQFSNDYSQPVRDSTRKTFAEFWRQHGDLWHIQKKKLTENQLQVLNSLLISPSYYA